MGRGCDKSCEHETSLSMFVPRALFSNGSMATGSCSRILTGRLSLSLVPGENQPFVEMADPCLCSQGLPVPVRGRKIVFPEKFVDGVLARQVL